MKQLYFILLVFVFSFNYAQCPVGNVILVTQEQIDDFIINYPNCTEINGDLYIGGQGSQVSNLLGLQNIETISGHVEIFGCGNLLNLQGLHNLRIIGKHLAIIQNGITSLNANFNSLISVGSMQISNNQHLVSIDDFHNLESIEGYLSINQNYNIIEVKGFNNLETINGELSIRMWQLEILQGFQNLRSINGSFTIRNEIVNPEYELEVLAFNNLESIDGILQVYKTSLVNLDWLSNLTSVNGWVWFQENPYLNDFEGISNLQNLNHEVVLNNNGNSLNGIEGLDLFSISLLSIRGNSNLSNCSKSNICQYLLNGGEHYIGNNATGCNSKEEILQNCNMNISDLNQIEIKISPIPVRDRLYIDSQTVEINKIEVYSQEGKLVKEFRVIGKYLEISDLPLGTYILKIITKTGTVSKKIIKS